MEYSLLNMIKVFKKRQNTKYTIFEDKMPWKRLQNV